MTVHDPFRFELAPEDEAFRTEFRAWLESNVPREGTPDDEDSRFEMRRAWQRTMFDAGWAGVSWPTEYGGRGAGPMQQFIYYEELARSNAPELVNSAGIILFGPTLMMLGADHLKKKYLKRMLSAEDIWCQGFSEPEAGSDLSRVRTTAAVDAEGDWIVRGQKIWTSWAPYADYCAVLCRTEPDASRHAGMSLLIVNVHQAGVSVRPIAQITGELNEYGEIFFDDARAARDEIVAESGDGWTCAMTMLEFERSDLGLHDHGRLLRELDSIGELLNAAIDKGALPLGDLADLRSRYSEAWTRCALLRRLNLAVAHRRAQGEVIGTRASVVRVYYSELSQLVAELGIDVAGPESGLKEFSKEFLYSRSSTIAAGTAEVQRNIVAERVLGLPR